MNNQLKTGELVKIPEIVYKGKVELSSKKTALIIVDMQNDFVKAGGSLVVESALATVPRIKELLTRARKAKLHIAYTQDTQFEGDPEFKIWPRHCLYNSPGWQIIDELKPQSNELVCPKNRYDGFYGTWLDHFLSNIWKVENVIVVGTVANICVLHTAGSAAIRWFHVAVPADCISALNDFDQVSTLRQISILYQGDIVEYGNNIMFK
jgi:nicotinamidase-related amidase